ncbi:inositol hexakisphosphate and diphosphoinositol-pentakisphosphate kinase isoform X2 [Chrysoperla carnea]|uniref:inositol hexakisphosphate and diphosphoinositol-pentakisphosphate kinase isoform X2 n=1 Tax=Chrysoperla carnea TaxID=189513 RepID=UPI001D05FA97|nr:inositol hexakisphosphate and diphosphoinositol-pentakisphosphate kinase isoform X2 [Chrysoperla carnea]
MEWSWLKDWWRLKKWRKTHQRTKEEEILECFCDECIGGELELCGDDEGNQGNSSLADSDLMSHVSDGSNENGGGTPCSKQVVVGVCAMAKKSQSKPMKEILTRLQEFEYIKMIVFPEEVILKMPVEEWPACDCLISFHSKGFPLDKAIAYAAMHKPYLINNLHMQYDIQDRRRVYSILEEEGIEIPRYAVLDRDSPDPKHHELVESEDHVEVNGVIFNKPFVEKPVSAEDHNIYIYYPTSAGGGSQRLFRKIGSRSSVYSPESRVRKTGSFIYEDFMPTDGTDVKVYTVGPDYAHAEARKSPALDGKVERDSEGKEIRYPVILSNAEKLISRKVCLAFKQAVCGFDLLRANGKSFVCDVNGFSFVKNSNKYYDDCAKILGNMILRELAPTLHIPWSVPFQLDDPPIVPTTFGKMMELRCVVAVIRHGDRTPKQKMKVEVRHPKFFEIFEKYDGYKHGHVKLKRPKQLQEILDIARSLLADIAQREAQPEIEEKQGKLEQLKSVLEMYGHFSGINRKVQMKYQPRGRPRGSSSDDGKPQSTENTKPAEPSLVLILKWGGELTPAGRIQAEELGRIFRCMYPGGQGRHLSGEYAGTQGLGLLRLHSTFRHDLKIYASDEGRVQMTAAAFAKGLLALEGELTPILVQMVKSANTNGLLDNDCDSSKYQNMCKARLHELMQLDREFTDEERKIINPGNAESIAAALEIVKNPARCCQHVHSLIHSLMDIVRTKRDDPKTKDAILYHGETWELMGRRWGKIEKDFCNKNKKFDISKIPDIYDCIKYDLQHNQHTLQFEQAEELYMYAKYLADIVIPQEYGLTQQEKLTIGQGICTPLLKKIRADLQRNIEEFGEEEETVNRLNPRYSHGVSSPGRHVRTRLYFTSESHVHSLLTVLRYGGLLDVIKDEQWRRAMQYISMVSELNYMAQLVVMLYEDPTKDPSSEERFHVELHFSPGVNCCVQKNLPPGPGFRPHSRSESATANSSGKNSNGESTAISTPRTEDCSTRIDEEVELSADVTPTELSRRSSNTLTQTESTETRDNVDDVTTRLAKKKSSDPIPIGNSHTVSGHEAAHLAKRLTAELAQQQGRSLTTYENSRTVSPDSEPRARSFDQQRGDVNQNNAITILPIISESTLLLSAPAPLFHSLSSPEFFSNTTPFDNSTNTTQTDDKISQTSTRIDIHQSLFETSNLSPIEGSVNSSVDYLDTNFLTPPSLKNDNSELSRSPTNEVPLSDLKFHIDKKILNEKMPESATNELPLTELKLMTPRKSSLIQNEIFDRVSESNNFTGTQTSYCQDYFDYPNSVLEDCPLPVPIYDNTFIPSSQLKQSPMRSYSDPNILDTEISEVQETVVISPYFQPVDISLKREASTKSEKSKSRSISQPTAFEETSDIFQYLPKLSNKPPPSRSCSHPAMSLNDKKLEYENSRTMEKCLSLSPNLSRSRSRSMSSSESSASEYIDDEVIIPTELLEMDRKISSSDEQLLNEDKIEKEIGDDKKKGIDKTKQTLTSRSLSPPTTPVYAYSHFPHTSYVPCVGVKPIRSLSHPAQFHYCYHYYQTVTTLPESSCTTTNNQEPTNNNDGSSSSNRVKNVLSNNNVVPKTSDVTNTETGASTGTTAINVRRHRHSIAGQMSYFKMLGFGFGGGPLGFKKIGAGSTNSLFSTAVISGSSSAPNLRDMIPNTASASTVEGFGGVPPIRPLETLHNALSLRQLDEFLERMTCPSTMMRTPASSPPKSCPLPAIPSSSINDSSLVPSVQDGILSSSNQPNAQQSHNVTSAQSLRLQSPSNSIGWSGPPSFVSSSGPSSPTGLSDVYSRESSDMSASLISSDGYPMGNNNGTISQLFPTAPGLDDDLGNVGLLLETGLGYTEFESISQQGDNGDITPVSAESEFDFNTADATAGSTVDADLTVTEDILDESSAQLPKESSDNSLIGGNNGNNNSTNNLCSSLINPCTTSTHIIQNDLDHHRSINLLEINNPIPSTSSLKKTNNTASVSSSSAESLYKTNNQTKKTELHRAFSFNGPRNNTYTFCSNNLTDLPPPQPKPSISPSLLERSNSLLTTKCNNNVGRNYYRRQNSTPNNLDSPQNLDKNVFNKNCSDKWAITKERFLVSNVVDEESSPKFDTEIVKGVKLCNFNKINNPGAVLVKEAFIEPLKLNRIQSKSFHGKTTESSSSNESTSSSSSANLRRSSEAIDSKPNYRKYHTQKSLPGMSSNKSHSLLSESIKKINESVPKPRFTTTIVDEGYATNNFLYPSEIKENIDRSTNSSIENHADIFATNQSVERDTLASVQKQSSGATSNNSIPTNDSNVHKPAPVLVLASSLTDKSHIVHGFNIKSNNDSDSLSDQ